jgi:adenosylcobinamide-phosphate synthase
VGLASALAARSLTDSVLAVLEELPATDDGDLDAARRNLGWIVGRDVQNLNQAGLLRAAAETASENAVDGVFAPLFWMGIGALLWMGLPSGPGPLALAWAFKASSTLDSMLGYRTDRLRWLGTAGARLDDLLTWLPCRLVMLTLPLVCPPWTRWAQRVRLAEQDGAADPSPNAGRSEAIYAHCIGIQLGGENRYGERRVLKPVLGAGLPTANAHLVRCVLNASGRLESLWLSAFVIIQLVITL